MEVLTTQVLWQEYYTYTDGILPVAGICVNKLYSALLGSQICNQVCTRQCEYVQMTFAVKQPD